MPIAFIVVSCLDWCFGDLVYGVMGLLAVIGFFCVYEGGCRCWADLLLGFAISC